MYDDGPGGAGEPDQLDDPVLPPLTAQLLAAYLATEVVDADGVVWSGVGALQALAGCWVITAENPFSRRRADEANRAANARLVRTIEAAGFATTQLVGRAADESWSESCLAVSGPSLEQICSWGREHGQHAVFRLTGSEHEVVSCWTRSRLAVRGRVLR